MTDPIADYLTRIRNAQQARHRIVEIPSSNLKQKITEILYDQGFIHRYKFVDEGPQGIIKIALRYDKESNQPVIRKLGRISKPGLRKYCKGRSTAKDRQRTWNRNRIDFQGCDDQQASPGPECRW